MKITFSTCWYVLKAKFDKTIYETWILCLIKTIKKCNFVIYTDSNGKKDILNLLETHSIQLPNNFLIVLKPLDKFKTYKYKDKWISNHEKNVLLNRHIDWKLNMLWSEKVHFVNETCEKKYFDTELYGWCDIGYFRNRYNKDTPLSLLTNWPNTEKLNKINKNKIYYACINNNNQYIQSLFRLVANKNINGLPINPIPENQLSIAGGFFIVHEEKVLWWKNTYDEKLSLYFKYNYLIKDDQIIIADCIFSNLKNFQLCKENNINYDNWFLFQRFLQ